MDRLIPSQPCRVLCAFSGGADSAALLCLLIDFQNRRRQTGGGVFSLFAAHVHHGIRGAEADRDAAFCADFCRARGVPFFKKAVDAPAYAKARRIGLEEAARELRYRALDQICEENGIDFIVTAHNATDQLETMLMHLIRGSGLDGLCGIPEQNGKILRPLLSLEKETILDYCTDCGIPFVTDSTNSDDSYTRNFIRLQVLPLLKQLNRNAASAAFHTSCALTQDRQLLSAMAEAHCLSEGRKSLAALPASILVRVLRREFHARFPDAPMLTSVHLRAMTKAVQSEQTPLCIALPGDTELLCDRDDVLFRFKDASAQKAPEMLFLKEGWQSYDGENGMFLLRLGKLSESDREKIAFFQNIYNLANNRTFHSATMNDSIFLRARNEGDAYFDGRHTRNVRKLLQTLPLPAYLRARYPILCDNRGILWIPGCPSRAPLPEPDETPIRIFCFYGKKNRDCP